MKLPPSTPITFEPVINALAAAIAPYLAAHLQKAQVATEAPQDTELLTQKEAAAFLKCNVNTLIKWGKKDIVKFIKKGNRVYYQKADLLAANNGQNS